MEEKEPSGLPEARRFTAARRALFLAVLERTGNQRAAAAAIEMDRGSLQKRRKRDPKLDSDWKAAEAEASQRLGRADSQFGGVDGDFEMIRRGPGGRLQIVATGPGRWCKSIEDRFFEVLGQTGNVSAAARAIGFSDRHIGDRRRQWPGFARRWEETLQDADARLEFRLACHGNNVGHGAGERGAQGNEAEAASPAEESFDPEFALKYLKWREEKKAGRGRRGRIPAPPTIEEVTERIVKRVQAIKRHCARGGEPPGGNGGGAEGGDSG
jgi:hypothetical protein